MVEADLPYKLFDERHILSQPAETLRLAARLCRRIPSSM